MKTNVNKDMIGSTEQALARYSRSVAVSRRNFLRSVSSLPQPLARRIRLDFKRRIARNQNKPLLGEYAPWLLADLISLRSRRAVSKIASPWLHIYFYTLFTDDILDRSDRKDNAESVLANGLLLQSGLSSLLKTLPRRGNVRLRFNSCFIEAAEAALGELRRCRGRLHEFTDSDIDALGKKVALLKACACCLIAADGQTHVSDELLVPIEHLATGAQLLDDAVDWEEDWRAENYTYVLASSFSILQKQGIERAACPALLNSAEVMAAMIITGSLERSFKRGTDLLKDVKSSATLRKGSATDRFLKNLIEENIALVNRIVLARRRLETRRHLRDDPPKDWLGDLILERTAAREVALIDRRLKTLSQGPST